MPKTADIAARVAAIRAGAEARAVLGQAAQYARLPDGWHQVTIRGRVAVGVTLAEAIDQAREHRP